MIIVYKFLSEKFQAIFFCDNYGWWLWLSWWCHKADNDNDEDEDNYDYHDDDDDGDIIQYSAYPLNKSPIDGVWWHQTTAVRSSISFSH